ncbi:unnamed protein product [Rodentolepis nana]|uniref:Pyridoxal phosphate homeostasis protein n=1 Tax=Rodentolepis nana TaxID=102285 RepID=A0A0R3T807_RODNA|nr:unnamed protein product [Rodentolepis nana]
MNLSIARNLECVLQKIDAAFAKVENTGQPRPKLIAVSKTKPSRYVIEAYNAGQKVFGENYVQELVEKSHNEEVRKFMFSTVPNLAMVETVSNLKIAHLLDSAWEKVSTEPLDILIQVNISGEEQKGGVPVSEVVGLFKSVSESCPHLKPCGLMMIGKYDYDQSLGPNPEFQRLYDCRDKLCETLGLSKHSLHLSMGMSSDYEMAITMGSTLVRVGSNIFGSLMPIESKLPIGSDGKPLKPCCACPETRKARDECIISNGEEKCRDLIEAHLKCLPMEVEKRGPRFRIIGSLMPRLQGREVCLLGKAVSVDASGQKLTMQTADGVNVICQLPSPLQASYISTRRRKMVSPDSCIVEVQGTITKANEIHTTAEPIIFSRETSASFDLERYAYAVNMTVTFDGLYMQSPEE